MSTPPVSPPVLNLWSTPPPVLNLCLHHQCQTYVYTTTSVNLCLHPPVSSTSVKSMSIHTPPVLNLCLHHQCQTYVYTTTSVKPMSITTTSVKPMSTPSVSNLSAPPVSNLCLHHQCQICVFTTSVKPVSTPPVSNHWSGVQKLGPELHQYSQGNVIKDQAKFENKHERSSASVQPANDPSPNPPPPPPPPNSPPPQPHHHHAPAEPKSCLDLGAVVIHQPSDLPFQRFVVCGRRTPCSCSDGTLRRPWVLIRLAMWFVCPRFHPATEIIGRALINKREGGGERGEEREREREKA